MLTTLNRRQPVQNSILQQLEGYLSQKSNIKKENLSTHNVQYWFNSLDNTVSEFLDNYLRQKISHDQSYLNDDQLLNVGVKFDIEKKDNYIRYYPHIKNIDRAHQKDKNNIKSLTHFISFLLNQNEVEVNYYNLFLTNPLPDREDIDDNMKDLLKHQDDLMLCIKKTIEYFVNSNKNFSLKEKANLQKLITDQVEKNLIILLIAKTLMRILIQDFISDLNCQDFENLDYTKWNSLVVFYHKVKPMISLIEKHVGEKTKSNKNLIESMFIPNINRSIRLKIFYLRQIQLSIYTNSIIKFQPRKVKGRVMSLECISEFINHVQLLHQKVSILKFINPILCYYIDDRLFTFEDGRISYKQIFNNQITKYPLKTVIDRKRKFIDLRWQDYESKEGMGMAQHLIEKLQNSGNKEQYELSQLIKQQMRLTKDNGLDPEVVYNNLKNGTFNLTKFQQLNLVICKNQPNVIQQIVDTYLKDKIFMYNVFRITKDQTTNFQIERQQVQHGMSSKLLHFLGYSSVEEFSRNFIKQGFPDIYQEISDIYLIKQFYQRDLDANKHCLLKCQNKYSQKPIIINVMVKDKGSFRLTLHPGKTFQVVNNQFSYDIIRTFTINKSEMEPESEEIVNLQNMLFSINSNQFLNSNNSDSNSLQFQTTNISSNDKSNEYILQIQKNSQSNSEPSFNSVSSISNKNSNQGDKNQKKKKLVEIFSKEDDNSYKMQDDSGFYRWFYFREIVQDILYQNNNQLSLNSQNSSQNTIMNTSY